MFDCFHFHKVTFVELGATVLYTLNIRSRNCCVAMSVKLFDTAKSRIVTQLAIVLMGAPSYTGSNERPTRTVYGSGDTLLLKVNKK